MNALVSTNSFFKVVDNSEMRAECPNAILLTFAERPLRSWLATLPTDAKSRSLPVRF